MTLYQTIHTSSRLEDDPHCFIHAHASPDTIANVTIHASGIQHWLRLVERCLYLSVFWCNICDWVMAQLALSETEIVDIPQMFLLFATDAKR